MICIIDYDIGNIGSIENMIKKIGHHCVVSRDLEVIRCSSKLILPGVGAFDFAMEKLEEYGLIEVLNQEILVKKKPVLGICLGMHLMTNGSDEGIKRGLGWIDAEVRSFDKHKLQVPHMGWNAVKVNVPNCLINDFHKESRFYFAHSFYVKCNAESDILLTTEYGGTFTSAFAKENIWGVQFHPEKSHKFGKKLLQNFCIS